MMVFKKYLPHSSFNRNNFKAMMVLNVDNSLLNLGT